MAGLQTGSSGSWGHVAGFIVGPLFVAVGLWMVVRPAAAYRFFYSFWTSKPPTRFDLLWSRIFGCVFAAGSLAWTIGFTAHVVSH